MKENYHIALTDFAQLYTLFRGIRYIIKKQDYKHFELLRKGGYVGEWRPLIVKYLEWHGQDRWLNERQIPPSPSIMLKNIQKVMEFKKQQNTDKGVFL